MREGWSSIAPLRKQLLHQALVGHILDAYSMICGKLLAATIVLRSVRGRRLTFLTSVPGRSAAALAPSQSDGPRAEWSNILHRHNT